MQQKKAFAFKVAQKVERKTETKNEQWKAREGVAVAGCSGAHTFPYVDFMVVDRYGRDQNAFC